MDLFPLSIIIIITIILFASDFQTKGKYRTRPVALIILAIGLILGIIYALAGS
jgi:hypothetical protein